MVDVLSPACVLDSAHGVVMDVTTLCEVAGCGGELAEPVTDSYGRGVSVAKLAMEPIVRVCDEHTRMMDDLYVGALALAVLYQQNNLTATEVLRRSAISSGESRRTRSGRRT